MSERPNILLIVMDSVRATNLSCYGYPRATSPHLDQLAKESTLFEQAISTGCWTLPVHASLFTGLHQTGHGMAVSRDAWNSEVRTLAGQLRDTGYQTACFSNNPYISSTTGLTSGFEAVYDLWKATQPRGTRRSKMARLVQWLKQYEPWTNPALALARQLQQLRATTRQWRNQSDRGAVRTLETMHSWLANANDSSAPFFMFVNYMESHEPYQPPYPYNRRFMPAQVSSRHIARVNKTTAANASVAQYAPDELEIFRALYDGTLGYLDSQIGRLVAMLQQRGVWENTAVIITSDHGDSLGEHAQLGHRMTLYEPLVHVPLIIRYPRRFSPGTRVPQPVSLLDLYPTILELAGEPPTQAAASEPYSLLAPPSAEDRPFTFAENTAPKSLQSVHQRMIRSTRYKYLWKSNGEHELYDLQEDPAETVNLVERQPQIASRMEQELQAWLQGQQGAELQTQDAYYDQALQSRLRALGYLE